MAKHSLRRNVLIISGILIVVAIIVLYSIFNRIYFKAKVAGYELKVLTFSPHSEVICAPNGKTIVGPGIISVGVSPPFIVGLVSGNRQAGYFVIDPRTDEVLFPGIMGDTHSIYDYCNNRKLPKMLTLMDLRKFPDQIEKLNMMLKN